MFIEKTGKNISSSGAIYRRSIRRLQIKDYKIEYIANLQSSIFNLLIKSNMSLRWSFGLYYMIFL